MNNRLKEVRNALNLTLAKFAAALETTPGAVSNWEHGEKIPRVRIYQICSLFNVSRVWLETGAGDMFEREEIDAAARVERLAGDLVALLPEKERRVFIDAVQKVDKNRPK